MPGRHSRNKGSRVEREIVSLHDSIPCAAEKVSRAGYTGCDLMIADIYFAEVKSRKNGQGFSTISRWLGENDLLFLREDGRVYPMVVMRWTTYADLLSDALKNNPLPDFTDG